MRRVVISYDLRFGPEPAANDVRESSFSAPGQLASLEPGASYGSARQAPHYVPSAPGALAYPSPATHAQHSRSIRHGARPQHLVPIVPHHDKPAPTDRPLIGPHDFGAHLSGGLAPLPFNSTPAHSAREHLGHRDKTPVFKPHGPYTAEQAQRWEAEAAAKRANFAKTFGQESANEKHLGHGRVSLGHRERSTLAPPPAHNENYTAENAAALRETAHRLGAPPKDLATVMAYETMGSFSPRKWGGKGGHYMGLIQFGPRERQKYGAHEGQNFKEQLPAVEAFLKGRGFKPGMGLHDLYSTVLAGRPGLYHRRDQNGSVTEHVNRMMRERGEQAERFLNLAPEQPPKTADR